MHPDTFLFQKVCKYKKCYIEGAIKNERFSMFA
jgi:hypothetical protein